MAQSAAKEAKERRGKLWEYTGDVKKEKAGTRGREGRRGGF